MRFDFKKELLNKMFLSNDFSGCKKIREYMGVYELLNDEKNRKERYFRKLMILMITCFLLLNVAGCGITNNDLSTGEKWGNSNGNLVNGGMIAYQDKDLYFSFDGILYKSQLDGSEVEKIYETGGKNGYISKLNVIDDKIVFYGDNRESGGLYRIKNSGGSKIERLISEPTTGIYKNVYVIGDYIYYDSNYILKLDGNGSDKEQISQIKVDSSTLNIDDGYIYYCEQDVINEEYNIFKMKVDGSDNQKIYNRNVYDMLVYDGWIYYQDNHIGKHYKSLYKIKVDGTEKQLILDKNIGGYNIKDEWIYYISKEDKHSLYKMKTDGSENQKIDLNVSEIDENYGLYIVEDWLYFVGDDNLQRIKLSGSKQEIIFERNSDGIIKDLTEIEQEEKTELNNTYQTRFGDVNMVTFPVFEFDLPSTWNITEEVTSEQEIITIYNDRGVTITYSHLSGIPVGTDAIGGSSVFMSRVNVSKVANSSFVPSYVQATDYSTLGNFVVAKLKVTGELDMKNDSEFKDVDGSVSYAVLPESRMGIDDSVRNPDAIQYGFNYGSGISFIASAPKDGFSKQEEKLVIEILKSFRIK